MGGFNGNYGIAMFTIPLNEICCKRLYLEYSQHTGNSIDNIVITFDSFVINSKSLNILKHTDKSILIFKVINENDWKRQRGINKNFKVIKMLGKNKKKTF
jgi:hypothetical protein